MTRTELDVLVYTIAGMVRSNQSTRPDPARITEEAWSEGYTLGTRGDQRVWCQIIRQAEDGPNAQYWFRRTRAAVIRKIGRA